MIPNLYSATWSAIAPAFGNHLWQSTLFAIAAGLLTLVLRKNHARARYWLWLAASAKFLIPFALLTGLGSHLAWSRGSGGTNAGLYFAMEEVSQPFTQPTIQVVPPAAPLTAFLTQIHLLPMLLTAVWLCGFVVVLSVWSVRWWQVSTVARNALIIREGREVEVLRRLERIAGRRHLIEIRWSRTSFEPGIFGMARPVLVWPEGISERLEDEHLEAILAHELWHVRRRDNLAAAMHMLVEAIFWFHPLVWWMGARLVEERERACDEEVLESGSDREVYAESILKICEFCVGSPLTCVSGVTGADLKKRIVHIMTEDRERKLDFSRKLLLSVAGILAVVAPIAFGLLHATQTRAQANAQNTVAPALAYENASIKPNQVHHSMFKMMFEPYGFSATSATLRMLIRTAYGVEDYQISGAPKWLDSEGYDVEAKMDSSVADELRKLSEDQRKAERQRMLQALLTDRFKLALHHESKELPAYALVVAKDGPKLQAAKPGDTYPNGFKGPDGGSGAGIFHIGMYTGGRADLVGQGLPMATLVQLLSERLQSAVLDKTGLKGNYDFTLQWTTDVSQAPSPAPSGISQQGTGSPSPIQSSGSSIFTAIQEQLGLKLELQKSPGEILVIDHVEKPSEN